MSIRLRLTIMFLVFVLVPSLFVSALTFRNYRNSLEAVHLSKLQDIAALKADKIEAYIAGLKTNIKVAQGYYNIRKHLPVLNRLAHDPSNAEFRSAKKMLDEQLRQVQAALDLADIMLVNPAGKVVYSSNPQHSREDFFRLLPDPLQKAFSEGKHTIYFSDVFLNKALGGQPSMLVSAPAYDFDGTFIGIIAFEVGMGGVYTLIQDVTGLGNTGEVLLGKKTKNEVIYLNPLRHDPEAAFKKSISMGAERGGPVQEAVQGRNGAGLLLDYRGKKVIAAWRYIPALDWGMVAKIDAEEVFADVTNLRRLVVIILIIVIVLCGILAFSIAQSISLPIKTLTQGAEIIGSGNLDHQIGTGLKDEIGQLSRAFDRMTRDLKKITASRDELNSEITERKRTEEAIRAHKEWLDLAQQSARVGAFEWNIQTGRAIWSKEMEALYGLKPGEFDGSFGGWTALVHPEDREAATETAARSAETGEEFDHEFRVVWPDGNVHWLHGRCTVMRDSQDRPHRMIGIVSDITARKQAEILKEARLRVLTEANISARSSDEIITMALDEIETLTRSAIGFYHFMEADQETLSLQSWSTNTLRNMCTAEGKGSHYPVSSAGVWVDCVHRRRPVIHNDYASLLNRKELPPGHAPVIRELVVPIMRGGRIVAIIGVGNKPTDYDETDIEIVSYLGDLSWEMVERKRAEETLLESEQRLKRAQEIAHLGSWELDLVKNVLTWSDETYRIFGLRPREFSATYEAFLDAVHPDDRAAVNEAYSGSLREGRDAYEIEHRVVRKTTGEVRIIREKCAHIRDASGRIIRSIGMVHDITERKQAEQALEASLREKEILLKEIHHRVKNNLQVISSLVSLQADSLRDPALLELFAEIRDRVRSMALVHEKLYQSGGLSMLDFADYAASLLQYLWRSHGQVSANVRLNLAMQSVNLPVDTAVHCGLMLNELASNALKHAFQGRTEGEVTVGLEQDAATGLICLLVRDNGVGLPEGMDWRQSQSLGLRLVQMLTGQLRGIVETGSGPGAEFRITFAANDKEDRTKKATAAEKRGKA